MTFTPVKTLAALTVGVVLIVGAITAPAQAVEIEAVSFERVVGQVDRQERAEAAAMKVAVATGEPTVVDSLTTETALTEALPDGTFQQTIDTVPVRVEAAEGWIPVDPSLILEDGYFVPAATTVAVRFSAGGTPEIAQVQLPDGSWMTETWPYGDLPAPLVEGPTATYLGVLPDVDLQLTAKVSGMSEVLVIHTEAAAQDPRLETLQLGISGADVTSHKSGLTVAVPEGESAPTSLSGQIRSSSPVMWDSADPQSGPQGPGGADNGTPVESEATESGVTLTIADGLSDSPTYPVYVDPDWTGGKISAWYTDSAYPNQGYPDGGPYADSVQRAGYVQASWSSDGNSHTSRAYWSMDTSGVAGKRILSATFNTTETYASSCNPRPIELWWTGAVPAGSSWNQAASYGWIQLLGTQNVAYGYNSSCPASAIGFPATAGVVAAAAANASSLTLGMRASNEGDTYSWKKFTFAASLIISYNSIPNVPTSLSLASPTRVCGTSSAPAWVSGTAAIAMQATSTDADAGNVATRFYVVDGTDLTTNKLPAGVAPSGYLQSATQAQGVRTATIPANTLSPGLHAWRATTWDGTDVSGASSWCYFQVKNSSPGLPTVLSRAAGPYTVGQPTTVRFASTVADKVAVFAFWWSYSGSTSPSPAIPVPTGTSVPGCDSGSGAVRYVCAAADGTSSIVTVAPVATSAVLWVASIDLAGNVSVAGADTATPISFAGVNTALADTTGVSYSTGHGWPTIDSSSPLPASIADANTNSGSGLTSAKPLSLSALIGKSATAAPLVGDPAAPVFDVQNLIALNRYYNPTTWLHYEMTGAPPAGFQYEMTLGWIVPPIGAGQTQPANTSPLYRCLKWGNEDFLSPDSACEGRGNTPVLQGYRWNSAPTLPAGTTLGGLTACNDGDETATPNYDENCAPKWSLGYTILAGNSEASGPAVDTTQSFTVSAWLKPGNVAGRSATAVSQSGASKSGFGLKVGSSGRWQFCLQPQVGTSSATCAEGSIATAGSWQFVTGTWDAANQQLRINVGDSDTPDAVAWRAPVAGDTTATGKVMLAGLGVGGASTEGWFGQIAHPTIFPGVAEKSQRQNLYFQSGP